MPARKHQQPSTRDCPAAGIVTCSTSVTTADSVRKIDSASSSTLAAADGFTRLYNLARQQCNVCGTQGLKQLAS